MIAVFFDKIPAALEDLVWVADDRALMESLNRAAASFWAFDLEAADPDPDLTHAKAMAEAWGGEIVGATEPEDFGDKEY